MQVRPGPQQAVVPQQVAPLAQQRSLSQQVDVARHDPELFGQHCRSAVVQLPFAHGTGALPGQQC
jgi:hypothetical protein